MKELLEAKLEDLEWLSKNASNWEYYLGQYDLCRLLLSEINGMMHSFHQDDYYDDEWHYDPLEEYYSDLAMYKHEEISDMYNKHYHYSWCVGKNVINTDSMWFTSDEIEAFRTIWQRRISAI